MREQTQTLANVNMLVRPEEILGCELHVPVASDSVELPLEASNWLLT